ncbi:MAG TPA: 3-isopropylmalate dehydratase small subunit [Chloroflexota bacterium]|nr:3-isopropylmalate dehydratase small subunit [Chloroflexota bacterium]
MFGDDVNTDVILPGKYLKFTSEEGAAHVMEGIDPTFAGKVQRGDIIVGGVNFGCGSSRESAPGAIKYAGVAAVVAVSFARIFYRNAINLGLPVLVCPEARRIRQGDRLVVDVAGGEIRIPASGEQLKADALPPLMLEMLLAGGLVPYLERKLKGVSA